MLKSAAIMLSAVVLFCMPIGAANAQNLVADALKDCSSELKTYCSSVTPGGGRLVSCAKAHEDKLSSKCISAINRAGFILETLARTLTYIASQCGADALKYCPEVNLGEERVLNCLSDNKAKLTKYCGLALSDIGR
jgi:hypothetical protein